ncbi:MAG: hypothetical protein HQL58_01010 [Magnetococcales bacterium]|nr:hypothetical protein [Magnetococcales bacterium]
MLQLIPYGLAIVVGGILGKKIYPARVADRKERQSSSGSSAASTAAPSVQILRETVVQESPIILAVEEIPLDNRFGNKVLVSEHEFVRSATIELTMGRHDQSTTEVQAHLWRVLQHVAQEELRKSLNIEVGAQISRRVRITLSTEPGQMVRYKVIWKQDSRRGLFEVKLAGKRQTIPYTVAFGLSHTIESVEGERKV